MFLYKPDKNQVTSLLKNWAFLGNYEASSGDFLPTFRDNLSVPSSGFKNLAITQKSAVLSYFAREAWNHAPVCYMTSSFGSSVQDLNRGPWPVIEEID